MNDQYLQYNLEDFLSDDSFVNWVLNGTDDNLWQIWMEDHPEFNARIQEAKLLIKNLRFKEEPINQEVKKQLWNRIEADTQAREVTMSPPRYRRYISLAVAASIAFLILFVVQDRSTTLRTDLAMTESFILPSSSEVTLAPLSQISYKEKSWEARRDVSLTGQGHFKVSKGVPFTVRTENGSVRVLGTEFDVVSDKDAFQVLVTEGRVNATSGNHERILTAGMAFFKNPAWSGSYELTDDWKTDDMFFAYQEEVLSDVLKAIAFSFDLTIDQTAIDNTLLYTGSFDTKEGPARALEKILWPLQIEYNIINKHLVLSPR